MKNAGQLLRTLAHFTSEAICQVFLALNWPAMRTVRCKLANSSLRALQILPTVVGILLLFRSQEYILSSLLGSEHNLPPCVQYDSFWPSKSASGAVH